MTSMSETTSQARAVIIGAGIVGNSSLSPGRLGWRDLVLVTRARCPTRADLRTRVELHLSGRLLQDDDPTDRRQYPPVQGTRVFTESGGIEIARTDNRRQELRRRASAATAWGVPTGC